MKELEITGGIVLLDEEDYVLLKEYNWCINNSGYAWRSVLKHERSIYQGRHILMHRLIMGLKKSPEIVDHKNRNKLDNRKSNLRIVDRSQNHMNSTYQRANSTTGYKGVYYRKDRNKYSVKIEKEGQVYRLGCFASAEEAALAYNEKAADLFGEFAALNVIKGG